MTLFFSEIYIRENKLSTSLLPLQVEKPLARALPVVLTFLSWHASGARQRATLEDMPALIYKFSKNRIWKI